jgi:glutamine amidotransferase
MCRPYGFLATEPTRLECSLVDAQNALQTQSDRDSRGNRNADGWGIAHWIGDDREVIKSTMPAFADDQFAETASGIWSEAAIAHVRAATVGKISPENTHPFTFGTWACAHNGTIPASDHVATRLDIGPYGPPDGGTDSELAFLRILNRMAEHGLDPGEPADGLEPIVELLTASVLELVDLSMRSGALQQPKLNSILSDGRHLAASRVG